MIYTNEARTDRSELKDPIHEWFAALTGAIAQLGACRRVAHHWQPAQPSAAPLMHAEDAMLGVFLLRLLAIGGLTGMALYLAQSVDWPDVAVNLVLKGMGLL